MRNLMTADNFPRVSSSESDSSSTKQRKRRKWDQPDERLISDGVLTNIGTLAGIVLPTVSPLSGAAVASPFSPSVANPSQVVQSRIQDELISREIMINDADSAIRYKLTKRQTQEEIQKCTSAVVITHGKYRPPNAPPDGERPLYLHVSAAAHLETTAERIKAVDLGAAMVEKMLKQGSVNNEVKVDRTLTTCVFLGFEADPSWNITSRICGPNDQYVNHIMNETGATVLLRGHDSGSSKNEPTEDAQQPLHLLLSSNDPKSLEHAKLADAQQPLHLLLSSNDPKSLEHAKLLAENLLDTISGECGASRASHCNLYGAVSPPSQLEAGLQSIVNLPNPNYVSSSSSTALASVDNVASKCYVSQYIGESNPGVACYPHTSSISGTTSYIGYGGIYSQATHLQQVALALGQSTSPVTAAVSPITTAVSVKPLTEESPSVNNKWTKKWKFRELPATAKGQVKSIQKNLQGSEFPMPRELTSHVGARDVSTVIAPNKSVLQSFGGMPPPPPPKFNSLPKLHENNTMHKSKPEIIPDTLINIMEYGDDDDDELETFKKQPGTAVFPKPFWAV
ncbi:protein RIK-like isoform X2 [Primulina eburnea]|uniref:protein RIK-like isoform X2 n=1 Tax=Primulina eburnea TaxID=1245227 RepID=UPI003C6BDAE5